MILECLFCCCNRIIDRGFLWSKSVKGFSWKIHSSFTATRMVVTRSPWLNQSVGELVPRQLTSLPAVLSAWNTSPERHSCSGLGVWWGASWHPLTQPLSLFRSSDINNGSKSISGSRWQGAAPRERLVQTCPNRMLPLSPHLHNTAGQHSRMCCCDQVSTPKVKSHQLLRHLSGHLRPPGSYTGDAMEGSDGDRWVLAVRCVLQRLGGFWHHVLHRLHLEPVRN